MANYTVKPGLIITYASIHSLTDLSINSVHQAAARGPLSISDLESVVLWVAEHGKQKLRKKICCLSASSLLEEDKPRLAKKQSKSVD